jgi:hypothetical protein
MIVDFPKVKTELDEQLTKYSRQVLRESGALIRRMPVHLQHEGEEHQFNTLDGAEKELPYQDQVGEFTFSRDELPTLLIPEIFKRCADAMREMAGQIEREAFRTIGEAVDEVGNTLKGVDPCNPESFLAALDKIQMDFDGSRQQPVMPTLFADEETIKEFQRRFEALTSEQRHDLDRRREEIVDRKYAEYLSRESDRKLVD